MEKVNPKLKLLYLVDIFREETDEKHGLTMPEIIECLDELGIPAERKALYTDIDALREYGLKIEKLKTQPVQYALVKRDFSNAELLLLADAVQSCKFLTQNKANNLLDSIKHLGSKRQMIKINKRVHVEGRITSQNESVFNNIDIIQSAIDQKRKISFLYFKYNAHKEQELQHDGDRYEATPVQLMFSDGCYYLVTYNDKYADFTHYRVDRMLNIMVSEQKATRNADIASFNPSEYESRLFGMYSGDVIKATLEVDSGAMSGVIDRFGKDVQLASAGTEKSTVHVTVMESPTFYGWLAQFNGNVRIVKPASAVKNYKQYLQDLLAGCDK